MATIQSSRAESTTCSSGFPRTRRAPIPRNHHNHDENNEAEEGEDKLRSNKDPTQYLLLYRAALEGDWKCAFKILQKDPGAKTAKITRVSETVLHIAVGVHHAIQFVKKLVDLMPPESLEQTDDFGRTSLASAAIAGNTKAAKILVRKNPNLPHIRSSRYFVPLHYAARYGHEETVLYLLSVTKDEEPLTGTCGAILLNLLIAADFYGIALDILKRNPKLAFEQDNFRQTAIQTLAQRPMAFKSGSYFGFWQRCIYHTIAVEKDNLRFDFFQNGDMENPTESSDTSLRESSHHSFLQRISTILPIFGRFCQEVRIMLWSAVKLAPGIKQIYDKKLMHTQALELVRYICAIATKSGEDAWKVLEEPLRTAARLGIDEFVAQILRTYPELIWSHDKQDKVSIFHIAVLNRHEKVFSLIYQISSNKHPAAQMTDTSRNNILHLAGFLGPSSRISGAALQMQRELQWFREVEQCVQPSYRERTNIDGLTPRMVFTEEHKKLVEEGEKWMKDTASSCTVVAALIVTVVFAAAFTVPGGNTSEGYPLFLTETPFMVFAISDALGLFSSSTSVLMFLGILTSRYSEDDFFVSLPRKMIIGLLALFFSIAAMMVAFSATLYIALVHRFKWIIIPIAILGYLPVNLFVWLQFPLLLDMFLSTYGPSIFHRKAKRL